MPANQPFSQTIDSALFFRRGKNPLAIASAFYCIVSRLFDVLNGRKETK
jgi:hypothetical protein